MPELFKNNALTTLAGGGVTNVATSLTVATGKGALFPSPGAGEYFMFTLDDGVNIEVCQCTARSGDVFTIVRGRQGTTGTAFSAGAKVEARPTAGSGSSTTPSSGPGGAQNFAQLDAPFLMAAPVSDPATPAAGSGYLYLKAICGKVFPKVKGPSGLDSPWQNALFQNSVLMVSPQSSTTIGVIGGALTSVGTVSHPAPDTTFGYAVNQVTGAVAGNTAGTGDSVTRNFRGSSGLAGGWLFAARLYFPDASYGSGATGFRAFVGLTNGTMAAAVGADDPGGHCAGFTFSTNAGDTVWSFSLRDGTTRNKINSSIAFTAQNIYDFFTFCPPNSGTVYWRVDNLTAATTSEGNSATNVPGATTQMRCGLQIATLTTTARNVRYKRIYCETDL